MIDYTSIIAILESDYYIDKTGCFEDILSKRFLSLEQCAGTGSSLFLRTLACFLDKEVDSRAVFQQLEIGKSALFEKEINSYCVVLLDFSDFDADSFDEAVRYLSKKMSGIYKHLYALLPQETMLREQTFEDVLGIIEEHPSQRVLNYSLRNLLYYVREKGAGRKLALLVDDKSRLLDIAKEKGYFYEMRCFLDKYTIEDAYRHCDLFLQIIDAEDELGGACIFSHNIHKRLPAMIVERSRQHPFVFDAPLRERQDWAQILADGRTRIEQVKREDEERRTKQLLEEKRRYATELSPEVPLFSPNLGIRRKKLDKGTKRYAELNTLLQSIYTKSQPDFSQEEVYRYLQNIDTGTVLVQDSSDLCRRLQSLPCKEMWRLLTDDSSGHWIQASYHRLGTIDHASPDSCRNIKVYACFDHALVQDIFIDSLTCLLEYASCSFAAKIARWSRNDQLCYWISPADFFCLEQFFVPHVKSMKKSLPFVAYKGMLGIGKDFPAEADSTGNSLQAHIISDYFKQVGSVQEIDLEDMYNNYIAKWNADKDWDQNTFKKSSVASFIVALDSLDANLGEAEVRNISRLLSNNVTNWLMLADCCCWADVNEAWKKQSLY